MLELTIFKQFSVIAIVAVLAFGYYKWHAEPVGGDLCIAGATSVARANTKGQLFSCQSNVWREAQQKKH